MFFFYKIKFQNICVLLVFVNLSQSRVTREEIALIVKLSVSMTLKHFLD